MITLDDASCALVAGEQRAALTGMEFRTLKALAGKTGVLVSRSELTHALYSDKPGVAESNVIEVLVSRLRKKFKAVGARVRIMAIRGEGYMLVEAPQ